MPSVNLYVLFRNTRKPLSPNDIQNSKAILKVVKQSHDKTIHPITLELVNKELSVGLEFPENIRAEHSLKHGKPFL